MRLGFLDVVRGVAVSGVVLVHSMSVWQIGGGSNDHGAENALLTIFASGRFGVELFFLLSGYLLATIYSADDFNSRGFAKSRFFRIWPLWAVFSIIWLAILSMRDGFSGQLILAFLLALSFALWTHPQFFDSFIGGAWSIQIEVLSYILFFFLRKRSTEVLVALAVGVNLLGIIASFFSLEGWGLGESLRRLSFQTGFNFFLLGWLGARHLRIVGERVSITGLSKESREKLLLLLWLLSFVLTPAIYGNPIEAAGFVSLGLLFSGVVRGRLRGVLQWLGRHSYFIFFMHFVILALLPIVIPATLFAGWPPLASILVIPLSWILILSICSPLAWLSMRFFESPLMRIARS
ncbi:acyltransferase [Aquiluna sp. KACHI24]|uniref:acyltransferase family protein n=1 Tax=Aquiluna sp. KACHI24 TaxID=2968831 RepID=UPI002200B5D7|nr:acyltransferase [Aquiluna sp. KACHI24]BDQ00513.1 hypothetical protein AKACHI_08490 [Aquiluna sp. KACHI24]